MRTSHPVSNAADQKTCKGFMDRAGQNECMVSLNADDHNYEYMNYAVFDLNALCVCYA